MKLCFIAEEPTCNFVAKPNAKLLCEEVLQLTCTVRYAANESYVVANMKWLKDDSSRRLRSSMETSTSENITTATSKLDMTGPQDSKSNATYKCSTTFRLRHKLPEYFATNEPDYSKICIPNTADCKSYTILEMFINSKNVWSCITFYWTLIRYQKYSTSTIYKWWNYNSTH